MYKAQKSKIKTQQQIQKHLKFRNKLKKQEFKTTKE